MCPGIVSDIFISTVRAFYTVYAAGDNALTFGFCHRCKKIISCRFKRFFAKGKIFQSESERGVNSILITRIFCF